MKQWQAWVGSVLISSLFWLGCASSRLSEKREPYASFQFYYEQNNEKIEVLIESYPDKKIPYNHITGKDINARDDYFDGTIDAVVEGNKEEIEKMYKFGLDRANALGQVKEVEWAFVYLARVKMTQFYIISSDPLLDPPYNEFYIRKRGNVMKVLKNIDEGGEGKLDEFEDKVRFFPPYDTEEDIQKKYEEILQQGIEEKKILQIDGVYRVQAVNRMDPIR